MAYEFTGSPIGPYYGPNRMLLVQADKDGVTYQLNIFADLFNAELRNAGKPLQFYYLPDEPRIAKNDSGDYMFHFTKFLSELLVVEALAVEFARHHRSISLESRSLRFG